MATGKNVVDSGIDFAKGLFTNSLESNKAINPGGNANVFGAGGQANAKFFGGAHAIHNNMKKGDMGFWDATKTAHQTTDGKVSWGAIAGSAMTAGAAIRVASGGGLYRDQNGQTDIMGVPFI